MTEHDEVTTSEAIADTEVFGGLRRFRQVAGCLVTLFSLLLVRRIQMGTVGAGYQGDEGLRIFDAYQTALGYPNSLYGGFSGQLDRAFFGVHPPGDGLVRGITALVADTIGIGVSPVSLMFLLSIGSVGAAHFLAAELAFRVAGWVAGLLTLSMLFGSFVFNDIRVSSMGEAIAMPMLVGSLYVIGRALRAGSEIRFSAIALAGALFALATFTRPEPAFLLPGLCLALWYVMGFLRATAFGALAGSFEMAKLINSAFFAADDKVSILNVGDAFHNGQNTVGETWRSDFVQQLIREPSGFVFLAGVVASVAFLASVSRDTPSWKMTLVLSMATVSYLGVNIAAQLTGLAPHASYRVVIAVAPLMTLTFAIAFVGVWPALRSKLASRFGDDNAYSIGLGAVVLLCGWGMYDFVTDEIPALEARVPVGVRDTADFMLERASADDGLYVDRMRYFESGVLGYFADRDAPVCSYARCSIADDVAKDRWTAQRSDELQGFWGEFNTVRMHTYIDVFQPKFIALAAEDIHVDWQRVASGIWGEEASLWSSHIYPYLDTDLDFDRPGEHFVKLGTVEGIEYFDSYVYLVPRGRNDLSITFEAFYGRTPEGT